jgi:hypothetical protein
MSDDDDDDDEMEEVVKWETYTDTETVVQLPVKCESGSMKHWRLSPGGERGIATYEFSSNSPPGLERITSVVVPLFGNDLPSVFVYAEDVSWVNDQWFFAREAPSLRSTGLANRIHSANPARVASAVPPPPPTTAKVKLYSALSPGLAFDVPLDDCVAVYAKPNSHFAFAQKRNGDLFRIVVSYTGAHSQALRPLLPPTITVGETIGNVPFSLERPLEVSWSDVLIDASTRTLFVCLAVIGPAPRTPRGVPGPQLEIWSLRGNTAETARHIHHKHVDMQRVYHSAIRISPDGTKCAYLHQNLHGVVVAFLASGAPSIVCPCVGSWPISVLFEGKSKLNLVSCELSVVYDLASAQDQPNGSRIARAVRITRLVRPDGPTKQLVTHVALSGDRSTISLVRGTQGFIPTAALRVSRYTASHTLALPALLRGIPILAQKSGDGAVATNIANYFIITETKRRELEAAASVYVLARTQVIRLDAEHQRLVQGLYDPAFDVVAHFAILQESRTNLTNASKLLPFSNEFNPFE